MENLFFYQSADDNGGGGSDANIGDTANTQDQQVNDFSSQLKDMENRIATMQSNFDRKNTEFQKLKAENEELKKSQMDEKKRKQYEQEQYEQKLKDKELELARKELELNKTRVNSEKNISQDLGGMIKGETIEEYTKNLDVLTKILEARINAEVEKRINEKLGGTKPPGGGNNQDGNSDLEKLIKQYNEAELRKDTVSMGTIQGLIKAVKEKLK